MTIISCLQAVADLVMPRRCLCCEAVLSPGDVCLCAACEADIPFTFHSKVRNNPMAEAFNALVEKERKDEGYIPYSYAAALYFYRDGYREISKSLKYHRNFAAGKHVSTMLGGLLSDSPFFKDVDAVIPIPLHWMRRWSRGYNQAEIIAEGIASKLNVPVRADILRRPRHTRSQTSLGPQERSANTRAAFAISRKVLKDVPELKHILLTDDVFTTGATALACERALRQIFPHARISVATLAFVGN